MRKLSTRFWPLILVVSAVVPVIVWNSSSAQASITAPISMGAMFTIKDDGGSGVPVAKVRLDAPGRVQIRAYPTSVGATGKIDSVWVDTISMDKPTYPNTHYAEIPLPAGTGTAGTAGGWTFKVRVRPPAGTTVTTDPIDYSWLDRPAKGTHAKFTFAVGSCMSNGFPSWAQYNTWLSTGSRSGLDSPIPALQEVTDSSLGPYGQAIAYMHLGDMGYPDNALNVAQQYKDDLTPGAQKIGYLSAANWTMNDPTLVNVFQNMPVFTAPDDHDYGSTGAFRPYGFGNPIPADATFGNGQVAYKAFAAQVFEDTQPLQPFGGVGTEKPNYRNWSIGDADFFLLDNRRWSDPQGTNLTAGSDLGKTYFSDGNTWYTQLGATQRNWLESSLGSSNAKLKVVLMPMTFQYSWNKGERLNFLNYLVSHNVSGKVLLISGDKHNQAHLQWRPVHTDGTKATPVDEVLASPIRNQIAQITTQNGSHDGDYSASNPALNFKRLYPPSYPWPATPDKLFHSSVVFVDVDSTVSAIKVGIRVMFDGTKIYSATLAP